MATRVTGMYSGLDTESLIEELVKAKSTKVTTYTNEKTKLEWKQEKWKDLNSKVKSLQSTITSMQFSTDYVKKKTTVSNSNAVSVITGEGAMNSVQSLKINKLAKSGYLTGAELSTTDNSKVTSSTTLSELGITGDASFSITTGGKTTSVDVNGDTTMEQLVSKIKAAGVNANFDATNQRLFIGASASGSEADFAITANDSNGLAAMSALGINAAMTQSTFDVTYQTYQKLAANLTTLEGYSTSADVADDIVNAGVDSDIYKLVKEAGADMTDAASIKSTYESLLSQATTAQDVLNGNTGSVNTGAIRLEGSDAEIELNGAKFTSSSNNIEVNGLTFTCLATTGDGEEITVTTQDDTDGVYDMIKSFIKQYNELIIEMDKLYNADSASDYDVLSDEEKEAMTESEIDKWETTIKDSLLRRDTTLGTLFSTLKDTMAAGYSVNGTTMYLSDFGINTLSYFEAEDNEKAAYHIDGDSDDSNTSGNADKLKSMIASDSSTVVSYFTSLMNSLYSNLSGLSKSSDYTSYGSFYEDKKIKSDLEDWDDKIDDAEEKLEDYEDRWYSKFSSMETALSKLDSKSSYISSLFS